MTTIDSMQTDVGDRHLRSSVGENNDDTDYGRNTPEKFMNDRPDTREGSFLSAIDHDNRYRDDDDVSSYASYESAESYRSVQDNDIDNSKLDPRHRHKHSRSASRSSSLSSQRVEDTPSTHGKKRSNHSHSSQANYDIPPNPAHAQNSETSLPTPPIYHGVPVTQTFSPSSSQPKSYHYDSPHVSDLDRASNKQQSYGSFSSVDNSCTTQPQRAQLPANDRTITEPLTTSGSFSKAIAVIKPTQSAIDTTNGHHTSPGSHSNARRLDIHDASSNKKNYDSPYDPYQIDDETTSLLTSSSGDISLVKKTPAATPILYHRRWYILFLFCMASMLQALAWATWGPITQSCKAVLGWTDSDIALQGLWGNMCYVAFSVPFCWLLERKGLRVSMIIGMFLLTVGFGMRCITLYPPWALWVMTASTLFLAGGSVVPYSAMTMLSSLWFPPSQRATATSIATLLGLSGSGLAFVIGPEVVPDLTKNETRKHHHRSGLYSIYSTSDNLNSHWNSTADIDIERRDMSYLMYGEAGVCAVTFLLILLYFPAKPPTPPSVSAQEERMDLKAGLKSLLRNRQFLLILAANIFGAGVYGNFGIVLDIDVQPLGVSQKTAGWFGFYGTVGACFGGILISRLVDYFPRKMKTCLIVLMVVSALSLVWFSLIEGRFIPFDWISIYMTTIIPAVAIYSAIPLLYELACEAGYPTGEGVITLIMTVSTNTLGSIFLAIFFIPNIGVMWMNYVLLSSVVISILLLLVTRVTYNRNNLDSMEIYVPPPPPPMTTTTTATSSQPPLPSLLPIRPGSSFSTTSGNSMTGTAINA